jgi:hypothetical protein
MGEADLDAWITAKSELDHKRLHALGVISHYWNSAEFWLYQLFAVVSGAPHPWTMIFDLGDVAICTRIRTITAIETELTTLDIEGWAPSQRQNDNAAQSDYVAHILDVYDLCRQNRNSAVHAWTVRAEETSEPVLARKSKRPDQEVPEAFPSTLADLRRVADDIERLNGRMDQLVEWYWTRLRDRPPIASLERLPLPALLWKPPPQVHTKRPPRP